MVEIQTGLRENTIGAIELFMEVAATDPLSAVVLLVGMILLAVSIVVFGVLAIGSVLTALGRGLSSEPEPIQ